MHLKIFTFLKYIIIESDPYPMKYSKKILLITFLISFSNFSQTPEKPSGIQRLTDYLNSDAHLESEYTKNDFIERGEKKVKVADYKGAMSDFTKAVDLPYISNTFNSSDRRKTEQYYKKIQSFAHFSRGVLKLKLEDFRGAIQDFNSAINLYKLDANYYKYRGVANFNLDNFSGALLDFDSGIEITGQDGQLFLYRGDTRIQLGHKDKGCQDLSKAGELGEMESYKLIKKNCN